VWDTNFNKGVMFTYYVNIMHIDLQDQIKELQILPEVKSNLIVA